jgi:DNA-directed RNA polymerase subunit RPC12/RpoP
MGKRYGSGLDYPGPMADPPQEGVAYEVVCPHCKREFRAEALTGDTARNQGFKCPHCRLFVAWERIEGQPANGS